MGVAGAGRQGLLKGRGPQQGTVQEVGEGVQANGDGDGGHALREPQVRWACGAQERRRQGWERRRGRRLGPRWRQRQAVPGMARGQVSGSHRLHIFPSAAWPPLCFSRGPSHVLTSASTSDALTPSPRHSLSTSPFLPGSLYRETGSWAGPSPSGRTQCQDAQLAHGASRAQSLSHADPQPLHLTMPFGGAQGAWYRAGAGKRSRNVGN